MYTELKMRKTSGKINISLVKYGMGIQYGISYITQAKRILPIYKIEVPHVQKYTERQKSSLMINENKLLNKHQSLNEHDLLVPRKLIK